MMTFKPYQNAISEWIEKYGVRYFDIKTNNLLLVEEVGELTRLIARKYGEQSFKTPLSDEEIKQQISDEMADIYFVLTCMANQLDINLDKAIKSNFDKKTKRDSTRHLDNEKIK